MSGRSNKLTAQIGEFLACAELGRQGLIATPFAGNVPAFDVVVADENCRSIPIQVKSSTSASWPSDIRVWMDIEFDAATGRQHFKGEKKISDPELIYIYVSIDKADGKNHRYFVLRKRDVQKICVGGYKCWMDTHGWIRPRNPQSYDNRIGIDGLEPYEDNWDLIRRELDSEPTSAGDVATRASPEK